MTNDHQSPLIDNEPSPLHPPHWGGSKARNEPSGRGEFENNVYSQTAHFPDPYSCLACIALIALVTLHASSCSIVRTLRPGRPKDICLESPWTPLLTLSLNLDQSAATLDPAQFESSIRAALMSRNACRLVDTAPNVNHGTGVAFPVEHIIASPEMTVLEPLGPDHDYDIRVTVHEFIPHRPMRLVASIKITEPLTGEETSFQHRVWTAPLPTAKPPVRPRRLALRAAELDEQAALIQLSPTHFSNFVAEEIAELVLGTIRNRTIVTLP